MNLTSKSRYALKMMMDIAIYGTEVQVHRADVARRQGVPAKYLDQIMIRLRKGGLVESLRGRSGGYLLAKPAEEISLWDIFSAVEDGIEPVNCIQNSCDHSLSCISKEPWEYVFEELKRPMRHISLQSLCQDYGDQSKMCPVGGLRECKTARAGGSSR